MTRNRDIATILGRSEKVNTNNSSLAKPARNLLVNGAMQIMQRRAFSSNAIAAVDSTLTYTLDNWAIYKVGAVGVTVSQDTSVYPTGFIRSLKALNTSTDSSVAATDRAIIVQRIEGSRIRHLLWGTSDAKPVTLSFHVRSSITGTHGGAIGNGSDNRSYPFTYTIDTADTWEKKTITIPGDTTGTWETGNARSLQVVFGLGVGTTNSGTAGEWAAADYNSATGATTSFLSTSSATWYLAGCQLEVGEQANEFEHKSYSEDLNDCLRYYYRYSKTIAWGMFVTVRTWSATNGDGMHNFPVPMRVAPTLTLSHAATATNYGYSLNTIAITQVDQTVFSSAGIRCASSSSSAFAVSGGAVIQNNGSGLGAANMFFDFKAEM